MNSRTVVLLCAAAAFLPAVAAAQSCLDQSYLTGRQNGLEITGAQSAVQTFTCGQTGLLLRVDVDVRHWVSGVTTPLDVQLLATDTAGVPTNLVLAAAQVPASDIPRSAYTLLAVRWTQPVVVQQGQVLALELSVPASVVRAYAWSGDAPGSYAAGTTFIRRNVGPLSFDMGFRTWVGLPGAQIPYGSGFPGTTGVPTLAASMAPQIGGSFDLLIGNSAGTATAGVLVFGAARANLPTPFGGTLLVQFVFPVVLTIPAGGASEPIAVPDDPSLCGRSAMVQALVLDSGAAFGLAFSPGLELVFGP